MHSSLPLATGLTINWFQTLLLLFLQGRRQRGGQWCPVPHLKSVLPTFTFGPPVAAYIQYCILKMWPPFWFMSPPSGFWPSLLLKPGDGPVFISFDESLPDSCRQRPT